MSNHSPHYKIIEDQRRAGKAGQPDRSRRKKIRYSAKLVGTINGVHLKVDGCGTLEPVSGRVKGEYKLIRFPNLLPPRVLNSVMVTGYPSVCQENKTAANPFAKGSYNYVRRLDFGSRGELVYTAVCTEVENNPDSAWLDSHFEITGNVDIPALIETAPIIETWTPLTERTLDGHFTIVWRSGTGTCITAEAKTEYKLPDCAVPPAGTLYRFIELENAFGMTGTLKIDQRSRLFGEGNIHLMIND
jgi:hypothetical protein